MMMNKCNSIIVAQLTNTALSSSAASDDGQYTTCACMSLFGHLRCRASKGSFAFDNKWSVDFHVQAGHAMCLKTNSGRQCRRLVNKD